MTNKAFVHLTEPIKSGDLKIANAARVAHGRAPTTELLPQDDSILLWLMRQKGKVTSSFGHATMTWYVKCPAIITPDWFQYGGTFTQAKPEGLLVDYYSPKRFRPSETVDEKIHKRATELLAEAHAIADNTYREMLALGVEPDLARLALPLGSYTEFYWTVDVLTFLRFLEYATATSAAWELRQYAKGLEIQWQKDMPLTHAAFEANGRLAP